jgi:hypothetical protein
MVGVAGQAGGTGTNAGLTGYAVAPVCFVCHVFVLLLE